MHFHFISLLSHAPWGGSEELWSQAADQLEQNGHSISYCLNFSDNNAHFFQKRAKTNINTKRWTTQNKRLTHRISVRLLHLLSLKQYSYANSYNWWIPSQSNLTIITSPGNRYPSCLIRKLTECKQKYVLVIQSVSESQWVTDEELHPMREAYRNAEAVFFVSQANLDSTVCQLAEEPKHCEIVSNPIKVERHQEFYFPTINKHYHLAYVGRLDPDHKGLDLLLRAIADNYWTDKLLHLNLYGDGYSSKQLRELTQYLRINEKVTFHGHNKDINKIWEKNHMLVMPSRHEGLPLAILEAMMVGRPCLVTDISGNAQYIEDMVNGFIAQGPTVKCVHSALAKAWEHRQMWEQMGLVAYHSIRKKIPVDPVKSFADRLFTIANEIYNNHN